MTPSQLFAALKTLFETKELHALLQPLATAAFNFASNPTAMNGVLQLDTFLAALIAAQPDILQSELKLIATDLAAAAGNAQTAIVAKTAAVIDAKAPAAS